METSFRRTIPGSLSFLPWVSGSDLLMNCMLRQIFPDFFPPALPFQRFAGTGTGLGKTNGTKVGIGYCYNGIYAQVVYPIQNKLALSAFYADNLSTGNKASRIFSFGINYRFSIKKTTLDTLKHKVSSRFYTHLPFSKLGDIVLDIDGNVYHTMALRGQVWMAENLMVTRFRDGSEIPDLTNDVPGSGRLYNWAAVNDSKNLCPTGWHVPSFDEWEYLFKSLGKNRPARKLEYGFSSKGKVSQWWSSTEQDTLHAQSFYLNNQTIGIMLTSSAKTSGFSVRCMRNY
jgi:Fibrobacter succinogenes major domain (Fib_succ_major)